MVPRPSCVVVEGFVTSEKAHHNTRTRTREEEDSRQVTTSDRDDKRSRRVQGCTRRQAVSVRKKWLRQTDKPCPEMSPIRRGIACLVCLRRHRAPMEQSSSPLPQRAPLVTGRRALVRCMERNGSTPTHSSLQHTTPSLSGGASPLEVRQPLLPIGFAARSPVVGMDSHDPYSVYVSGGTPFAGSNAHSSGLPPMAMPSSTPVDVRTPLLLTPSSLSNAFWDGCSLMAIF